MLHKIIIGLYTKEHTIYTCREQFKVQEFTLASLLLRSRIDAVSVNLNGLETLDTIESFTDRHIDCTPDLGQKGTSCNCNTQINNTC